MHFREWRRAASTGAALAALLSLAACGGASNGAEAGTARTASTFSSAMQDSKVSCASLAGLEIPMTAFRLPTSGASITSAQLRAPDASRGLSEYCEAKGLVRAANPSDPAINFQVNLPTGWNEKAVQLGGGGFNGTVVTGLGNAPHAPAGAPTPLAQRYVTFGSDSGSTPDGSFGLNAQALANYGGESVNRTYDAAAAVVKAYYQKKAKRTYYAGGSKGGHEGLVAVQRYAKDYDGVIAYYPANQNQAMVLSWFRMWEAAYRVPGGYLNPAKQGLLQAKVLQACDALDGAADGIVSNTKACDATFDVQSLRCPSGADEGNSCLSNAQIATLRTGATPMQFAFPLANGVTSIGPYPVFQGGDITGIWMDAFGGVPQATAYGFFVDPVIRFFDQQSPTSSTVGFDYRNWQTRVEQISQLYDATDPDIDTFVHRKGKLLIVQGTTDMLVPHSTTTQYVERLASRYGTGLRDTLRYYVVPGFGHASGTFKASWDSLSALDAWVEAGQAPSSPVVVDANAATAGRQRPLCEYPQFPKYSGSGDVNVATSFSCSAN